MSNLVVVNVTSTKVGNWPIAPYSKDLGLDINSVYEVPIYQVDVDDKYRFSAVRFGIVNYGTKSIKSNQTCDAGLSDAQSAYPTWVPSYSPHSFRRSARFGAWRIYADKQFLIHEGTGDKTKFIGGSLGCIEIVGVNEWNRFLSVLESQGGSGCAQLSEEKRMFLNIEKAARPIAKYIK